MKITLAPMEGVVDSYIREILTDIGGIDSCVTEFVRVVDQLLPPKVFYRFCPELKNGGLTPAGTPVTVQLLGSDPEALADNAQRAISLGAPAIDLNFGCPAKCVNKRSGGSFLLQSPETLYSIISTVRNAVPPTIPVSAKIRLGFENTDLAIENAIAVESAGANFVTVHARTKTDGYKAPARWEWIGKIRESISIPMIANGDINSIDDYIKCVAISGCPDVMIGRGAMARPDLALQIKHYRHQPNSPLPWSEVLKLVVHMTEEMTRDVKTKYIVSRTKQWLSMLKKEFPEAEECFTSIRKLKDYEQVKESLRQRLISHSAIS